MSIILSVISLILVVVILTSLQLTPATFSIFYHHALGKYSSKKADNLSLYFILGVELFAAAMWLLIYFILYALLINLHDFHHNIMFWIFAGITIAEAIIFFIYYFRRPAKSENKSRRQTSTALFLPRRFANALLFRTTHLKNQKDALLLGFFVGVPELIFTLPLFIIANFILLYCIEISAAITIFVATLLMTIPLFATLIAFHSDHNLANIQRFRAHIKPILHFSIPLCLLALSITLINLGLL